MSGIDFFVSYTAVDRSWAVWIAWQLEAAGYETTIQAWDFPAGKDFIHLMQQALTSGARVIAVLSPDYFKSQYCRAELQAAIGQDPDGAKGTLIPIRVRQCRPEGLLQPRIYIDLVGLEEPEARKHLLDRVQTGRAKPANSPAYPGGKSRTGGAAPSFPGRFPRIHNLAPRNLRFTGRADLFKHLKTALGDEKLRSPQILTGMGGVGKTQAVLEYAYREATTYQVIWWVRAQTKAALMADLASLAVALELAEPELGDQNQSVTAVLQWLGQSDHWLLIFDNADNLNDLHQYIPQAETGHVIVTSRNPNWMAVGGVLRVDPWSPEESIAFLDRRTGRHDAKGEHLANTLGHLPLALEQAGGYIEALGLSVEEYMEFYRKRGLGLVARGPLPADYPDSVARTWSLSFSKVEDQSVGSGDLLRLCAYFGPEAIPFDLLLLEEGEPNSELSDRLQTILRDRLNLRETMAALRRFSLVSLGEGSLSIHRLTQQAIRCSMSEEEQGRWAAAAVHCLSRRFPQNSQDVRTWPTCERLVEHVKVAVGCAEDLQVAPEKSAVLLNDAGIYLLERCQPGDARVLLERSLSLDEAVYGHQSRQVAIRLQNLGAVAREMGDLQAAIVYYDHARLIMHSMNTVGDPEEIKVLNNLALVYSQQGDPETATDILEHALLIQEEVLGTGTEEHALLLTNLGSILPQVGEAERAGRLIRRAMSIHERLYGPASPWVGTDCRNLAAVYAELGDTENATQFAERALKIHESAFGPEHREVALSLVYLSDRLMEADKFEDAAAKRELALTTLEKLYNENHPAIADTLVKLGQLYTYLGKWEKVAQANRRSLHIREVLHGPVSPELMDPLFGLALGLSGLGDGLGALEHAQRCLTIARAKYGHEILMYAHVQELVGDIFSQICDSTSARRQYEDLLQSVSPELGADSDHVMRLREKLQKL